jgi:hypothetical protein
MRIFVKALLALLLALIGTVAFGSGVAHADPNCTIGPAAPHRYSNGRWCDGTAANHIQFTWNDVPINVSDIGDWGLANNYNQYGHIDEETWVFTSNQSTGVYLESGIYKGFDLNNDTVHDWLWWSDTNPSYNGGLGYNHWVQSVNLSDGAQHAIQFYYAGGNGADWNLASDLTGWGTFGTSTHQYGSYAWMWTEGIEEFDGDLNYDYSGSLIDPDESTSGTFSSTLQVSPNGTSWHYPTDAISALVDQPCNSYPAGYCFNGTNTSAGNWNDNIPG